MRFHPRHYILIALILAVGLWNLVRSHRARQPQTATRVTATQAAPTPPAPQTTAAWSAFDKAAALRDSPAAQFTPAKTAFDQAVDAVQPQSLTADLKGCQTWLEFYRQRESAWAQRSREHLDSCVQNHADVSR